MNRSPSHTPVPKVVAAALGAAAATLAVWLISAAANSEPPVGVEGALATLFAFAAGYMTPPAGIEDGSAHGEEL